MRCPKCHYLSFDPEPRCKNCGFDLAMGGEDASNNVPDLVLGAPEAAEGPLTDLVLRDRLDAHARGDMPASLRSSGGDPEPLDESRRLGPFDQPVAMPPTRRTTPPPSGGRRTSLTPPRPVGHTPAARRGPVPPPTTELPLFVTEPADTDDDGIDLAEDESTDREDVEALAAAVTAVPPPTAWTPVEPAARKLGPLDRDLLEDLQRIERGEVQSTFDAARSATGGAGAGRRLLAAAVDSALLLGVAFAVVQLTLKWCELTIADVSVLPVLPLAAFVVLIWFGYLLLFTSAGGQTIGKMAAHIRVVAADDAGVTADLGVGQIFFREALALPSVLLLGAGFVPGLFGDQRTVYDRLAQTRVVRA